MFLEVNLPRHLLNFVVFLILITIQLARAAGLPSVENAMKDRTLGRSDAPVTIVEYSSLSCPHCMAFHRDVLPSIKKDYIDTGKVKLIFRDFPLGGLAMAAAMLARCAEPSRYFGLLEMIFRSQEEWSRSQQPLAALSRIGRFAGLSDADVQACFNNRDLLKAIQKRARNAGKKHEINSTPSFIIGGRAVAGALPYAEFKKLIDKELGKNKK